MTTELFYLVLSALLAGSLWVPYVIGQATERENFNDFTQPPDRTRMRPWVQRSFRAHQNAIETIVPFAVVVLVAHAIGLSTPLTVFATTAFFWVRVVHAVGLVSGLAMFPNRPIIFSGSYACIIAIAVALFLKA